MIHGLPRRSRGEDSALQGQEVCVQSLAGQLGSHMLRGQKRSV